MAAKLTKEDEKRLAAQKAQQAARPKATPQTKTTAQPKTGAAAAPASTQITRYQPSANVTAAQDYLKKVKDGGYDKQWSVKLNQLANEYMGRGAFEYDASSDVQWQQAKEQGLSGADLAMRDTMAQAAALSGGYGNSYAQTVGQQVYQQGVSDVMAMAPEYYQAAYQRYRDEGDRMLQDISLAQGMDEAAYARWADELSRAQAEYDAAYARDYGEFSDQRAYDYQVGRDTVADTRYDTEWQYQLDRDEVADTRYDTEWEYQKSQDEIANALAQARFDEEQRQFNQNMYRADREWQYQLDRDAVADERYNSEWEYQKNRDAVADSQFASQLAEDQRQFDADLLETQRQYDANLAEEQRQFKNEMWREDRDFTESQKNSSFDRWLAQKNLVLDTTAADYNKLKDEYDTLSKERDDLLAQMDDDNAKAAEYEKIMMTPKYANAKSDIEEKISEGAGGPVDVATIIYDKWYNGDFGSGEDALKYAEALGYEYGVSITDIFGR